MKSKYTLLTNLFTLLCSQSPGFSQTPELILYPGSLIELRLLHDLAP